MRTRRYRPASRAWLFLALVGVCGLVVQFACGDLNQVSSPNDVLILNASPSSIDADGFTTTTITAHVSPQTDQNLRDVIFTTTLGSFPASATGSDTSIIATVDSSGVAAVALQSSPQTGTAVVTAEIREGDAVKVTRSTRVNFTAIRPSDVIAVRAAHTVAPADGASVTDIIAELSDNVPVNQREILFTTTMGTFGPVASSTSRLAGTDNAARAGLVSPKRTGSAVVTIGAFGVMSLISYGFFVSEEKLIHYVGENAVAVVIRMMGLILAVIGTQMLIQGIHGARCRHIGGDETTHPSFQRHRRTSCHSDQSVV